VREKTVARDNVPPFFRVTVSGKVQRPEPMCHVCTNALVEHLQEEDVDVKRYPAEPPDDSVCPRCGIDYSTFEAQRSYAEYLYLKRLYRDADRAAERG
jgi:hypothetical protein